MKTNRLAISAGTAALALAALVACSPEQSTAPATVKLPNSTYDLFGNANAGQLKVCKNGTDAAFHVTFSGNFNAGNTVGLTSAGGNTYTFSLTAGTCSIIYSRPTAAVDNDPGVTAAVTEDAPVGGITFGSVATQTESGNTQSTNQTTRTGTVTFNMFHDAMVTFTNNPAPPTLHCTYTKGWYRNHGNSTVIAVDGRTIAQAQDIFEATPGKPNGVTWGADNANLNLYQQLLAALQNLGGDAHALDGPPALDAAITAALAATGGSGLNITVAAGTNVGGLTSTLSTFNEGLLAGGPAHCGDETL